MMIENDKFYTPVHIAKQCIQYVYDHININDISEIIEPSAGDGSFSKLIPNCISYDIDPQDESIIKQDYLTLPETYKRGRLYIGNPPFGKRNYLSLKFLKKNILYGDYIAYIQPILLINGNYQFYEFDLIFSKDLGIVEYSGIKLHCCFLIWKRPSNGLLNKKENYKLKSVVIKEYRRGNKSYPSEKIDIDNCSYAMCNWGSGSLGKIPEYVGQYAQEVYFYLNDESLKDKLLKLLEYDTIRKYCNNISMKRISVIRLYKYLKDNGFE